MFNDKLSKVNNKKIYELITTTTKLLKVLYVILIIVGTYATMLIVKELNLVPIFFKLLKIISPLFIGIAFAWLLEPVVGFFTKKGIKRNISAALTFIIFIIVTFIFLWAIIPLISSQFNDLSVKIPSMVDKVQVFIDDIASQNETFAAFRDEAYVELDKFGKELSADFANVGLSLVGSILSSLVSFGIGLMIGVYLLFNTTSISDEVINFLPDAIENDTRSLLRQINDALRDYVQGMFLVVTILFILASIIFWIIGLDSPVLFGLIVGITDLIPYIGPYIGGSIAAAAGFTISTKVGVLCIISMFFIQALEGFIFQPIIMSKTMKLHPVTIILGLLFFGYIFGIFGMIFATPLIAVTKIIFTYFNDKYQIFVKKNRKSLIINEIE